MPQDKFKQRKEALLKKADKSSIGYWDEKIKNICDKINSLENYYTTSSCSGRIIIMIDQEKKDQGLFIKSWHSPNGLNEIKKTLEEIKSNPKYRTKRIKFKQEPPILHIACKNPEDAKQILNKGRETGWKKSGILSWERNGSIVELNSTEKLEFPIFEEGKILINEDFLKTVLEESNKKMKKGWKKIKDLEKKID